MKKIIEFLSECVFFFFFWWRGGGGGGGGVVKFSVYLKGMLT